MLSPCGRCALSAQLLDHAPSRTRSCHPEMLADLAFLIRERATELAENWSRSSSSLRPSGFRGRRTAWAASNGSGTMSTIQSRSSRSDPGTLNAGRLVLRGRRGETCLILTSARIAGPRNCEDPLHICGRHHDGSSSRPRTKTLVPSIVTHRNPSAARGLISIQPARTSRTACASSSGASVLVM